MWQAIQNPDGGWAYNRGCSWTEPAALVLLAQLATGVETESFARGIEFLRGMAGEDGGFRPQAGVAESTWVTAVAAMLPPDVLGADLHARAIGWLKEKTGRESGWRYRLQQRLRGVNEEAPDGWPWFPGAAAWVIPTAFGILAFERALRLQDDRAVMDRVEAGREFLLWRMCADGGWNHGSNRALGRDGESYPETTGVALLALNGARDSRQLDRARARAQRHLETCRTAEGVAWLRMGLSAHGKYSAADFVPRCRTNMDSALIALANAGNDFLVS